MEYYTGSLIALLIPWLSLFSFCFCLPELTLMTNSSKFPYHKQQEIHSGYPYPLNINDTMQLVSKKLSLRHINKEYFSSSEMKIPQ